VASTKSDTEADRIVSLKDLAASVESIKAQLGAGAGKGASGGSTAAGTPDLDGQVARAVEAAREREKAQTAAEAQAKATEDRIKSLEERTEHRPTAYTWLTRWLWGIGKDES